MSNVKLFRLDFGDTVDWVIAPNCESALAFHEEYLKKEHGFTKEEIEEEYLDFKSCSQETDEQLEVLIFHGDHGEPITFKNALSNLVSYDNLGEDDVAFFASTDW